MNDTQFPLTSKSLEWLPVNTCIYQYKGLNKCCITMIVASPLRNLKLTCSDRRLGMQMRRFMSSVSLQRAKSCSLTFPSSQFSRKCTNMNFSKAPLSLYDCSQNSKSCSVNFAFSKQMQSYHPPKLAASVSYMGRQLRLGLSTRYRTMSVRLPMSTHEKVSRVNWNLRRTLWTIGSASLGVCLSFSTSGVHAKAQMENQDNDGQNAPSASSSHGKEVYTDYSITGIPGDGRCLFRSVAHGACIRSGKPLSDEALQRALADELRGRVVEELVKRRAETEWFIEGDFDSYVSQMRKPHIWGGEPELFMASHVLQMPITVYMHDEDSGGLIAIAEYGQEYGKENPVQVLYHGFGHYDALQIPGKKGVKSRL